MKIGILGCAALRGAYLKGIYALLLFASFLVSSGASAANFTPRQPDCSIALYGDSILHGAYVAYQNGKQVPGRWPRYPSAEIKAQRPAYTVFDYTVSGQSLSSMSAEFSSNNQPRIVVLGSGIAEGWFGGPIVKPMEILVSKIREYGGVPVITGFSRQLPNGYMTAKKMAGRDRADREAKAIAAKLGVQFADFGAAAPVEIVDDVHPNQTYSLRLTQQLIAALDRVAPECSFESGKSGPQ